MAKLIFIHSKPLHSVTIHLVEQLLKYEDIDPNFRITNFDNYPLYTACEKGHTEIVKLLVNAEFIDVNCEGDPGQSPLGCACRKGYLEIAEILLQNDKIDVKKGRCIRYAKATEEKTPTLNKEVKRRWNAVIKTMEEKKQESS